MNVTLKINHAITILPLAALMALAASLPSATGASPYGASGSELASKETPMEQSMEKIEDAFRSLRRSLRSPDDAKIQDYLKNVQTIKTEAVRSKQYVPKLFLELPEDKKAIMMKSYQKDMDAFIEAIDTLGKAVAESRWEDADAAIDIMRAAKSSGHEQYKKEE